MAIALAVTSDLIFSTKILGTARALGIEARSVSATETLRAALEAGNVHLVMVDMSLPGDTSIRAVECAVHDARRPTVIAFFSHVHGALGEAARRAGATLVMPRSKFSSELPDLLCAYCTPGQSDAPRSTRTAGSNPAARSPSDES